jgi:predicted nuclease of predicted toxin-antitoxin system
MAVAEVFWLRLGNVSTSAVLHTLVENFEALERFDWTEEEALLVLPSLPSA